MKPTKEQKIIHDYVLRNDGLTMTSAVAGSGKTTLLVTIANSIEKQIKGATGLYLAYNKSVATEAQKKFPKSIKCSTTHSLAYRAVVTPLKLSIGDLSYRTITEKIDYDTKLEIVQTISEYCVSSSTSFNKFASARELSPKVTKLCIKYLNAMASGKMGCTHSFYLKLYHLMLESGDITYPEFTIIALDEAGDLNPVTLAIFNLLPAKKKIMVGDPYQNIYTFNHTINCFAVMHGKGKLLPMSQSFRVKDTLATQIETFCQANIDPNMEFRGIHIEDMTISSKLFIARTNSALIAKMIECNKLGISYGLVRTPKQIFELQLILCSLKYRGFISNSKYKFLQADIDLYYTKEKLRDTYKTPLQFIKMLHADDIEIATAINTIFRYGSASIIECYSEASKHSKRGQTYLLGSCHSVKGLESDQVELSNDMNTSIEVVVKDLKTGERIREDLTLEETTELNLYYVACSRSRKSVINAEHLL